MEQTKKTKKEGSKEVKTNQTIYPNLYKLIITFQEFFNRFSYKLWS